MGKRIQTIKVKNYNDPQINRLAAACQIIGEMNEIERASFFTWCKSKWCKEWPVP